MRVAPRRPVDLWITDDISSSVCSEPFMSAPTAPPRAIAVACSAAARGAVRRGDDLEAR